MAKLYFRYGAMNSGKSTALLQAAHNYEERGQRVLLAKPRIDTKGAGQISSRLGMTRPVDFLIDADDDARGLFAEHQARVRYTHDELAGLSTGPAEVSCLLVDEAQFLTASQVDDLFRVAVLDDIPVLAYGIRMDVAHALEELKTICRCGRKALFNGRLVDGHFVFDGDQVAIDGAEVTYESLCGECYLRESGGRLAS